MNQSQRGPQPKWKYVLAFLVAIFASKIVAAVIALFVPTLFRDSSLNVILSVSAIIESGVWVLVWVSIYSMFSSLNGRKVVPYLWVVGLISIVLGYLSLKGQTFGIQENLSPGFAVFFISYFVALMVITLFLQRRNPPI